ncbi:MAG: branched-chain alpha-keto acid dehydrogenase subunit E2 [Acidobacteria bacterium RIFCSPLOWO2_12_FULL_67_14b]|nr:MAG: branched-chain alpha-keto acid dehydrogenase subunit E2 [Acidobacteria bacterium RIFCSPLOWO2_12_FULL_67_14b]
MAEFILPNLGDGVAQGDVLKVLVKIGDTIAVDQPVVELETDKATIEVPSNVAGKVKEIRVKAGDKVKPGQAVLVMENGAGSAATAAPVAPAPEAPKAPEAPLASPSVERPRAPVVDIAAGRPPAAPAAAALSPSVHTSSPAAPSVRRLAREIGVDVSQVTGTGPGGRITQDDVKEFAKRVMHSIGGNGQAAAASARPAAAGPALPDFTKWGEVERKPMTGIRRKTSEHLSHAWNAIPHVTQFDKADITQLEQVRKKYRAEVEKAGGNLTVTAVAAKVIASALKAFPQFNASVDAAGEAIVYKKYVHVGIAVDTENGLLVPVIRNADRKNLIELSVEINQLAEKAKARKLTLEEMSGGSMSISNLGGIGGTAFTPIINWPEVAILGISRGIFEPVWNGTTFEPRQMLPLSLSYDHRLIDGADAIRFLRWVAEALEQPFTLALRG